ncbi:hypothetical protein OBBRIDRAFT_808748 [Obba rivulosa]|uniref:Uncharacterized protein n=1 Tax=Obba rivulosa TaxID=1052685 RepID=A0A8E2AK42_9APHY|nr:hypothetical protein OBBRIDRAFT_808748 [Obba rivulosa]
MTSERVIANANVNERREHRRSGMLGDGANERQVEYGKTGIDDAHAKFLRSSFVKIRQFRAEGNILLGPYVPKNIPINDLMQWVGQMDAEQHTVVDGVPIVLYVALPYMPDAYALTPRAHLYYLARTSASRPPRANVTRLVRASSRLLHSACTSAAPLRHLMFGAHLQRPVHPARTLSQAPCEHHTFRAGLEPPPTLHADVHHAVRTSDGSGASAAASLHLRRLARALNHIL